MPAIWIALRLPHLPLEAVATGTGGHRPLATPSAESPREGFKRNPAAERAALNAIATVAYRFSGGVATQATAPAPRMHTVWLEARSSLRLFKGLEPLLQQLRLALEDLPYSCRLGVAPTPECAALLADAARPPADSVAALRPLPLNLLEIPDEMLAALRGSGLRTVGEILDLPIDELAMRFGQSLPDYLGRLTGRLPDTRRFFRLPERYRRRFEFDAELESLEALLFPLRRMLVELQQYLVTRDTGVQEFTLELEHAEGKPNVGRDYRPAVSQVGVAMSAASRDAAHLQLLLRERLERTPMAGPVRALTLLADRFATPRVLQRALFENKTAADEEWSAVLDRLRIRLGVDAVTNLGLNDDYRPEKSWRHLPPDQIRDQGGDRTPNAQRQRPLWLLPVPRPLSAIPNCVSGPERLESGWWDGLDATRDYYQAQTGDGARLWVFRDRRSGGWFLQGLWS